MPLKLSFSFFILFNLFGMNRSIAQEKILFQDNFVNNANQWSVRDNADILLQIQNGKYIIEHRKAESVWATWGFQNIDQNQGFKIHVVLKYIKGGDNHGFGLLWGSKDIENYYTFNLSKAGHFRYGKVELNKWNDRINWTKHSAIKLDSQTNTLTVIKKGNRYNFYANDVLLQSSYFEPFFGNNIGFILWNNQRIEIDSFTITTIPATAEIYDQPETTGALRTEKFKTAVVEFSELGDLGIPDAGQIVSDWLSTALNKTRVFEVYERISLSKLIEEQQFQVSGLVDEKTMAEIGKVHGVEAIITGNISKFGQLFSVNVKLIDVQNAKVIDSSNRTTKSLDEIPSLIDKIAMDLAYE